MPQTFEGDSEQVCYLQKEFDLQVIEKFYFFIYKYNFFEIVVLKIFPTKKLSTKKIFIVPLEKALTFSMIR